MASMRVDDELAARPLGESYCDNTALTGALTHYILDLAIDEQVINAVGSRTNALLNEDAWTASELLVQWASGHDHDARALRIALYHFVQGKSDLKFLNKGSSEAQPEYTKIVEPKYKPEDVPKVVNTYADGRNGLQQLICDDPLTFLNDPNIYTWLRVNARTQALNTKSKWQKAELLTAAVLTSNSGALHVGILKHYRTKTWARSRLQNPDAPLPEPIEAEPQAQPQADDASERNAAMLLSLPETPGSHQQIASDVPQRQGPVAPTNPTIGATPAAPPATPSEITPTPERAVSPPHDITRLGGSIHTDLMREKDHPGDEVFHAELGGCIIICALTRLLYPDSMRAGLFYFITFQQMNSKLESAKIKLEFLAGDGEAKASKKDGLPRIKLLNVYPNATERLPTGLPARLEQSQENKTELSVGYKEYAKLLRGATTVTKTERESSSTLSVAGPPSNTLTIFAKRGKGTEGIVYAFPFGAHIARPVADQAFSVRIQVEVVPSGLARKGRYLGRTSDDKEYTYDGVSEVTF